MGVDVELLAAEAARDPRVRALALGVHVDGRSESATAGAPSGTRFRIASITKPVVAEWLAGLARAGTLDLDAPSAAGAPSLRLLLAHAGGLAPDLDDVERFGSGDDALGSAAREVLRQPRVFAPGRAWQYCNAGYWVAASAGAEAAGVPFEESLDRRVLAPLGLGATGWDADGLAPAHGPDARALPHAAYPRARRPSGGLVSTVDDVLRFGVAALPLRAASADDPCRPTFFGALSGLGWLRDAAGAVSLHDGSWGGFCGRLAVAPEHGVVVAVLANAASAAGPVQELARRILRDLGVPLAGAARRRLVATAGLTRLVAARGLRSGV